MKAVSSTNLIIKILSSLRLTVALIFILSVLVVLGTLYQIDHGLYQAQEKIFNSYFFYYNSVPLPSARSIMYLLFLNLIFGLIFRFHYRWSNLGLIVLHLSLVILLISGFITLNYSEEAFVSLKEGEVTNFARDYNDWNLIIIPPSPKMKNNIRLVSSFSALKNNQRMNSKDLKIQILNKYANARIFDTPFAGRILKELPLDKNHENNIPALVLAVAGQKIELEGESQSSYSHDGTVLLLRREEYLLPFTVKLNDVKRELYPGTEIAKSYQSQVEIVTGKISRPFIIEMNKPFRYKDYTLYQANYGVDLDGNEFSILALVKSPSYFLPYIGSLLTALGLWIHFIQNFLKQIKRGEIA